MLYTGLKIAIFALLLLNAAFYMARADASSALDEAAWLLLLFLFEWEASGRRQPATDRLRAVIPAVRLTAAAAVVVAAIAFAAEGSWLDVTNSVLWIAVVALLESEVRWPHLVVLYERVFVTTAALLYGGLGLLVLAWAWRDEWLDAYDALLWILAFAFIELDMLRFSRRTGGASGETTRPAGNIR